MTRPGWNSPARAMTLWDIMNKFETAGVALIVHKLALAVGRLRFEAIAGRGADQIPDGARNLMVEAVRFTEEIVFKDVRDVVEATDSVKHYLADPMANVSGMSAVAQRYTDDILRALNDRKFLRVADSRTEMVDHDHLFGEEVHRAFPSAQWEIREAGNCLAADCNTAAVFHLMRVVEHGLRAFCIDVGMPRIVREFRKVTRSRVYMPVEYGTWDKILNQLNAAIRTKVNTFRRNADKQSAQEFYWPVHQEFEGFKDAFRNHVMHTRSRYSTETADAVFAHVKRFMMLLATRVKEQN
jgi:hypothetical protein